MKKALFLVNAVSGRQAGKKIKENIISELNGVLARDNYDIVFTEVNIARQIRNVSPDYETVVVVGGDGTIQQVVQGIVGLENKPKVGIIPTGTGNDLARSLGILSFFKSNKLRELLKVILEGKTINIDIISLGDKYLFTNYFGIGNDAKISNHFNRIRLRPYFPNGYPLIFNKVLYGVLGLTNGFYTIPFDVELKYRKEQSITKELTVPSGICGIIISNVKTYAGGDLLSSKCRMDDGKFEVTVISNIWQWLMLHVTRFLRKPLNIICSQLIQFQTDMLEIAFTGNTFLQIDGETLDSFPEEKKRLMVRIESHIEMIVP